jgi:hypothetical protein
VQRAGHRAVGLARDACRQQLLREVGIALGAVVHPRGERDTVRADDALDLQRGVLGRQPLELDPLEAAAARELGEQRPQRLGRGRLVDAQRHDEQQPLLAEVADQEAQQVLRRPVGPVDVLHHEHRRRRLGEAAERHQQQLEQPRGRPHGGGGVAALAQLREQRRQLVAELVPAQRGHDRRVGQLAGLERHALAPEDVVSGRAGAAGQLGRHPGLADPGLARDQHEPRLALRGLCQCSVESCLRVRAADRQRARDPARHMAIIAGRRRAGQAPWSAREAGGQAGAAARLAAPGVHLPAGLAGGAGGGGALERLGLADRHELLGEAGVHVDLLGVGEADARLGRAPAHRQNCRTVLPYRPTLTQLC